MEIDPFALLDKAREQAFVADGVDQARHALAVLLNPPEGGQGEGRAAWRSGNVQAVLNVMGQLGKFVTELLKHGAAERGFARAHLAGELHEALAFANPVQQVVERFAL